MNIVKFLKVSMLVLASIIVLLGVTFFSLNMWTNSILNHKHKAQELVLGSGKKQTLLIYQPSNRDTMQKVSSEIAELLIQNDYTVTINFPSKDLDYDIDEYDLLVFGSPVYFGKVSEALKAFANDKIIENRNIIIFSTGKFIDENKEILEMKDWFNSSNDIYTIKTNLKDAEILHDFIEKVITKIN